MKTPSRLLLLALGGALAVSATAIATPADDAYADITKTLGFLPTFFKSVPASGISAAWEEMKSLQMNPKTALSAKEKELIGLAVAAQIPCRYCSYFHAKASKVNGASDQEQKEAIAVAAIDRHWSTIFNGMQLDMPAYKAEVNKMFQYSSQKHPNPTGAVPGPITDSVSAYKDIERTFGFVPTFIRQFPAEAVAPAWREVKEVILDPNSALSMKDKDLISLAVASQIPCDYCVYMDTQALKHDGASDEEIKEAVAMSAITRHWSTILNGNLVDEPAFRRDVDRLFNKPPEKAKQSARR